MIQLREVPVGRLPEALGTELQQARHLHLLVLDLLLEQRRQHHRRGARLLEPAQAVQLAGER